MISLELWGEFLFAFWKMVKKYHSNETDNFGDCVKEMDALMKQYPQHVFQMMIFGFLEQKSAEAIRRENSARQE